MENELLKLCFNPPVGPCLQTDKYIGLSKFHSYIENFYGYVFPAKKYTTRNFLEIGIAHGGSVRLWHQFFPNAIIHAIDIDQGMCWLFNGQPRIRTFNGSGYSADTINKIGNGMFDIIIDDGPHTLESQCIFARNYPQKLAPGGILIIEDIANDEYLEQIGMCLPEHLQDKIRVHNTCEIDNRFDSRILWVQT